MNKQSDKEAKSQELKRCIEELVVLTCVSFMRENPNLTILEINNDGFYGKLIQYIKQNTSLNTELRERPFGFSMRCKEYLMQKVYDNMPWMDFSDTITFGKHKGQTIRTILSKDAQWIKWAINQKAIKVYDNVRDESIKLYLTQRNEMLSERRRTYTPRKYNNRSNWSMQDDSDFASAFDWGSQ